MTMSTDIRPVAGHTGPIAGPAVTTKWALTREGQEQLEQVLARNPDDAEAQALYATVNGWLITGMWSGMRRGPRADKAHKKKRASWRLRIHASRCIKA